MSSKVTLRVLSLCFPCLLLTAQALADEARVYVAPIFQNSQLTGDGRVSGGSVGTDFNLEDDLGVGPDEALVGVNAFFKFFGQRIQFSYYQDGISGTETLSETLMFDGTTFNVNERVETDIDLKRYELLYGFDLGFKIINFGFLGGAQLIDLDTSVRSSAGTVEDQDLYLPIPVIGVTLGIHPTDNWAIHAKLSGMSASISDYEGSVLDAHIGVDYLFLGKFGVSLGYKAFLFDVTEEEEDNNLDLDQKGPYIGLSLHL